MTKQEFSDTKEVKSFIKWFSAFWDSKALPFSSYTFLKDASEKYKWEKETFDETREKFTKFNEKINNCITTNNSDGIKEVIKDILNWGGVIRGNVKHINSMADASYYFRETKTFLNDIDTNGIVDMNKLTIGKFISTSGFSKIFSAINPAFIIYDSRVAFALCSFIKIHYNENKMFPDALKLYHGARSSNPGRNPNHLNGMGNLFPDYTGKHAFHFISLVKAKWILELTSDKIPLDDKNRNENIWRLQSALFMIGK